MPQGPGTYGSKRGRPPKKASAFTMKYKHSAFPLKSPGKQIPYGVNARPSGAGIGAMTLGGGFGPRTKKGTGSYNPEELPLNKYGGTDLSI